jgi:hypothetical protein
MPAPGWKKAGTVKIALGGQSTKVKASVKKTDGRYRDKRTGRFVSEVNAKRRIARAKAKTGVIEVETSYRTFKHTDLVEASYRAKLPKGADRKQAAKLIDAIVKTMQAHGHKGLAKRGKKDGVRFFGYVEGQAIDDKSGKRVRAGSGLSWRRSLEDAKRAVKDKIEALQEGKSLANDPHKTTGSGAQRMRQGPDTVIVTAVYGPKEPVPYLDRKTKRIKHL